VAYAANVSYLLQVISSLILLLQILGLNDIA